MPELLRSLRKDSLRIDRWVLEHSNGRAEGRILQK